MKKGYFRILLPILCTVQMSYACNCSIPRSLKAIQDWEYEYSECIFIGEVFKIDKENNLFEVKVVESFNGDEIGKTYIGIYDKFCGPEIDEKGKWLIYANDNTDSMIEINSCGITRSFNNPENNGVATKPPGPLSPDQNQPEVWAAKQSAEWKRRAIQDLENEIVYLRKRTKQNYPGPK